MSATHDFSRRFFADFIASRIKAWSLGEGGCRPGRPALAVHDDGPRPVKAETDAAASIDGSRGLGSAGA